MNQNEELRRRGYNPIRWNCENGCYNQILRPKIEIFFDCFPGAINFGDVDGIVEINARGLLLEWKSQQYLSAGQSIMYKRLTRGCILSVFCLVGCAETMDVERVATFYDGEFSDWKDASLEEVKDRIRQWVKWATTTPRPTLPCP